jgi:hypothetical protein
LLKLQSGILPLAKSTVLGWSLPGQGIAYGDCGDLRFRGCLNVEAHQGALDDPERNGKAFVQGYYRSCNRKECPKCYESWAALEASRSLYRLLSYSVSKKMVRELYEIKDPEKRSMYVEAAFKHSKRKPIHLILSVSEEDWSLSIESLRSKAYKIAKKSGFKGGLSIFHPFREHHIKKSWYWSPHFHMVGYGWIRNVRSLYQGHGWVIKNAGVRKSVFATLLYQLSHAGVHKDHHVVTWFGSLAYNKLIVDPEPEVKPCCPLCGSELVELVFVGGLDRPPPDEEGMFWLEAEDWRLKSYEGTW